MSSRDQQKRDFLARCEWGDAIILPLARDASFRSYDRVWLGTESAVLMDAPPEHEETLPFRALSDWLTSRGFSAPCVLAADRARGFLLLEDLGDDKFTQLLAKDDAIENDLYAAAVDLLLDIHDHPTSARISLTGEAAYHIPAYDMDALLPEVHLFDEFYLPMLGTPRADIPAFDTLWRTALGPVSGSREVVVLRDYHADNLMWLPTRQGVGRVGLLDFQDALVGHPAYDLVSLLQDARRDVAHATERHMLDHYQNEAAEKLTGFSRGEFERDYALLGAQRNTKIIGIFSRLWMRDQKPKYLDLIPRVWGLLERNLAHPALAPLSNWFDAHVPKALRSKPPKAGGGVG